MKTYTRQYLGVRNKLKVAEHCLIRMCIGNIHWGVI